MKSAHEEIPVIFGLRYLEEEDLELNDVVGCMITTAYPEDGTTYYTTNCDQADVDSSGAEP
jgi:hypothetical protein